MWVQVKVFSLMALAIRGSECAEVQARGFPENNEYLDGEQLRKGRQLLNSNK